MEIARHGTASHLEKAVAKYQGVQHAMEKEVEDTLEVKQDESRKLVYYQDADGMWVIHARLPAEAGSQLVKAINAVATPVQIEKQRQILERARQADSKNSEDSKKNVSAETFSESVEREDPNPYQDLLVHTPGRRTGYDCRAFPGQLRANSVAGKAMVWPERQ